MKKLYISEPHERNQSYLNSSGYQNHQEYKITSFDYYSRSSNDHTSAQQRQTKTRVERRNGDSIKNNVQRFHSQYHTNK